ncbi:chemotaxis protein CheW [Candidatus Poribacteria bacterium]|nr:chemotaxis protein CheW [Candidatus Poribacteria bacterium]
MDKLLDMVGELVIAHSMISQDASLFSNHDLYKKISQTSKIVRELQDLSMTIRMVPLKATFQKMNRLVCRELVINRGELLPIFRLHQLFNIDGAVKKSTDGVLMIITDGDERFALLVDELLGQQQVVTKSLNDGIGKVPGVSGAAILGNGCVGKKADQLKIKN